MSLSCACEAKSSIWLNNNALTLARVIASCLQRTSGTAGEIPAGPWQTHLWCSLSSLKGGLHTPWRAERSSPCAESRMPLLSRKGILVDGTVTGSLGVHSPVKRGWVLHHGEVPNVGQHLNRHRPVQCL